MEKISSYSSTTLSTHSLNAASVCMVLPPHYVCYISCMHFIVHSYRADWGRANCWGGNCRGGTACDPTYLLAYLDCWFTPGRSVLRVPIRFLKSTSSILCMVKVDRVKLGTIIPGVI